VTLNDLGWIYETTWLLAS